MNKPSKVWFNGNRGIASNESVLAGLRVLTDDSLVEDYPELDGAILLCSINLQHDGRRGRSSEVLQAILSYAGSVGKIVFLHPASGGLLTNDQLRAWYTRHGFEPYGDGMIKRP